MNDMRLRDVKRECRELLTRIDALERAMRERRSYNLPERSAVRRQSMEVTRALARLRRTGMHER